MKTKTRKTKKRTTFPNRMKLFEDQLDWSKLTQLIELEVDGSETKVRLLKKTIVVIIVIEWNFIHLLFFLY